MCALNVFTGEGISLVDMVLKLYVACVQVYISLSCSTLSLNRAKLHVSTERVRKEVNTDDQQAMIQLQEEIQVLREGIKSIEMNKQKEREEQELLRNTSVIAHSI